MNTKQMMYKTVDEPITIYDSEATVITVNNRLEIRSLEMDFLRRTCWLLWLEHIRNNNISQRLHMDIPITKIIPQRNAMWQVTRVTYEKWPKRVLNYYPSNRRKSGRLRRTLKQRIQGEMEGRNLAEKDLQDKKDCKLRWRTRRQLQIDLLIERKRIFRTA